MIVVVSTEDIFHFIYGNQISVQECLEKYDYKIVPIKNSPVVKYLQGFKDVYLKQSKNFLVREDSIKYHLSLYESGKSDFKIMAVQYKNRYIICDGMHRSSILYFSGHKEIKLNVVNVKTEPIYANFEPYILDEKFLLE